MAYAIGHISGCHLNPAVSIGLWAGKRFPARDLLPYIVAQLVGAIIGAGILLLIASGKPGFDIGGGLAANGYAEHSPGGYSLLACLVAEVVLTFMFLLIILGATDGRAPSSRRSQRQLRRSIAQHQPDKTSGDQCDRGRHHGGQIE